MLQNEIILPEYLYSSIKFRFDCIVPKKETQTIEFSKRAKSQHGFILPVPAIFRGILFDLLGVCRSSTFRIRITRCQLTLPNPPECFSYDFSSDKKILPRPRVSEEPKKRQSQCELLFDEQRRHF